MGCGQGHHLHTAVVAGFLVGPGGQHPDCGMWVQNGARPVRLIGNAAEHFLVVKAVTGPGITERGVQPRVEGSCPLGAESL